MDDQRKLLHAVSYKLQREKIISNSYKLKCKCKIEKIREEVYNKLCEHLDDIDDINDGLINIIDELQRDKVIDILNSFQTEKLLNILYNFLRQLFHLDTIKLMKLKRIENEYDTKKNKMLSNVLNNLQEENIISNSQILKCSRTIERNVFLKEVYNETCKKIEYIDDSIYEDVNNLMDKLQRYV